MAKQEKLIVKGTEIIFFKKEQEDYISLTDIAKTRDAENPSQIISLWMRTYSTIEYLGLWEMLFNPNFKPHIYEGFKIESAKPHFWMSAQKWINETNAIGITSKSGRYGGGTFAHSDIAFKFAAWLSAEFELYLVTEFKRLKIEEQKAIGWTAKRELAKINYHIHTSAVSRNLIPKELSKEQVNFNELICLSNMENLNAVFINEGLTQPDRLIKLNHIAIQQMSVLQEVENRKLLKQ